MKGRFINLILYCQSYSQSPTDSELTQSQNRVTCAQNANTSTKCQYVFILLTSIQSYTVTQARCANTEPSYLRPVNAVIIMLLITYFTTDRVLLSTFLLPVINNIITTHQYAIIDQKIVDGFPFPTIDPIIGTPDYESIADIHLKLNSNAASVQSNLGCGC